MVFSDNGPQFSSAEFKSFSQSWGFKHQTSSPYHSQSNGKAESAVKAAKRIMTLAKSTGEDPYLMLLEQRNIPTDIIGYSPVQRLFGRRTRSKLPLNLSALLSHPIDHEEITGRLRERQEKQKEHYDRGSRRLPELSEGENVWVQKLPNGDVIWEKGKILRKRGYRAYDVEVSGAVKQRNRIHLKKAVERSPVNTMELQKARCGSISEKGEDVVYLKVHNIIGQKVCTNQANIIGQKVCANQTNHNIIGQKLCTNLLPSARSKQRSNNQPIGNKVEMKNIQ